MDDQWSAVISRSPRPIWPRDGGRLLLFATSKTSPNSKWMPWELGYSDGLRQDRVGILPIVQSEGGSFTGQEYLGVYPAWQFINFDIGRHLGRITPPREGETLKRRVCSVQLTR